MVEPRTGAVAVVSLDELDRRLIEALQENGRESFRHIAKMVGVSEATVRSRYQRLVAANALQVTAITNPVVLGFEAISMVGVRTEHSPREVADVIISWTEATYVVITSGQFDLLVELVCRDRPHLLDLVSRLRLVDGVAQTETFIYFELSKQLYNWGARAEELAGFTNGTGG